MRETWRELALEEKEGRGVGATAKGRFEIRLGGVSCLFRKEIKPYEKFEVWTRVLSWDQKWLYIICHFVKPGVVKPKRYTLQPWRKGKRQHQREEKDHETEGSSSRNGSGGDGNPTTTPPSSSAPHPAIFAAGIAKYVFKKGRLTIPPERVIRASKLLPPKPPADDPDPDTPSPTLAATSPPTPSDSSSSNTAAAAAVSLVEQHITPGPNEDDVLVQSLQAAIAKDGNEDGDGGEWTWERVEAERKRGLGIAEMWASLEELSGEFGGDGSVVLGMY